MLSAWAALYLGLAVWWWPAMVIALLVGISGWRRTRTSADAYATLLEAITRLYTRELAERLGLDASGPLTAQAGDALTRLLTHSQPPLPAAPLPATDEAGPSA